MFQAFRFTMIRRIEWRSFRVYPVHSVGPVALSPYNFTKHLPYGFNEI
jgi:hypothetical protein